MKYILEKNMKPSLVYFPLCTLTWNLGRKIDEGRKFSYISFDRFMREPGQPSKRNTFKDKKTRKTKKEKRVKRLSGRATFLPVRMSMSGSRIRRYGENERAALHIWCDFNVSARHIHVLCTNGRRNSSPPPRGTTDCRDALIGLRNNPPLSQLPISAPSCLASTNINHPPTIAFDSGTHSYSLRFDSSCDPLSCLLYPSLKYICASLFHFLEKRLLFHRSHRCIFFTIYFLIFFFYSCFSTIFFSPEKRMKILILSFVCGIKIKFEK